jgi:hypothetical protein
VVEAAHEPDGVGDAVFDGVGRPESASVMLDVVEPSQRLVALAGAAVDGEESF